MFASAILGIQARYVGAAIVRAETVRRVGEAMTRTVGIGEHVRRRSSESSGGKVAMKGVTELESDFSGQQPVNVWMAAHQNTAQGLKMDLPEGGLAAYTAAAVEHELTPYVNGEGPFPMPLFGFLAQEWASSPPGAVLDAVDAILSSEPGSSILGWDFLANLLTEAKTPVAGHVISMMEGEVQAMSESAQDGSPEQAVAQAISSVCRHALNRSVLPVYKWPFLTSESESSLQALLADSESNPPVSAVSRAHIHELGRFRSQSLLHQFLARTALDKMKAEWGAWMATSDQCFVRSMVESAASWAPYAHFTHQAVADVAFVPDDMKEINLQSARFGIAKGALMVLVEESRSKPWLVSDLKDLHARGILTDQESTVVEIVLDLAKEQQP